MKNVHNSMESDEEYVKVHTPRWQKTLETLQQNIKLPPGSKVLEVSNRSPLAKMVEEAFKASVDNTDFDVRDDSDWKKMRKKYDLVLNCEIIEHLPDCDNPDGEFLAEGIKNCLTGCHRVLKPGGWLMLTTPNASSAVVLDKWIYGMDPQNWSPHPRELGYRTVLDLIQKAGFDIINASTPEVYDHKKTPEMLARRAWLLEKMQSFASADNRGETTFVLAKRK